MKKIVALFMSILMVAGLAACGSSSNEEPNDSVEVMTLTPLKNDILPINEPMTVVDNEFCTFIINEVVYDNTYDTYGLKVYLENKTDYTLFFAWENVSVNGYMCDNYWGVDVMPHKKSNDEIIWYIDVFEENGIDYKNVSNIDFNLIIGSKDENDYLQEFYVDDTFALNIA